MLKSLMKHYRKSNHVHTAECPMVRTQFTIAAFALVAVLAVGRDAIKGAAVQARKLRRKPLRLNLPFGTTTGQ
jgi:hypothetical protein